MLIVLVGRRNEPLKRRIRKMKYTAVAMSKAIRVEVEMAIQSFIATEREDCYKSQRGLRAVALGAMMMISDSAGIDRSDYGTSNIGVIDRAAMVAQEAFMSLP
jgi:hypothetical protein